MPISLVSCAPHCQKFRGGVRAPASMPVCTHSNLLPLISLQLPLVDEFAKRILEFCRKCLSSDSKLVSRVAYHGLLSACMISPFARNVFNCCSYFNTYTCNLWHLTPAYILKLYNDNVDVHTLRKARMLLENKIAKSPASLTTIGYRAICYVLLTTKAFDSEQVDLHQRQSIMIWILLLIYCNCKLVFHCVLCNC